MVLYKRVSELVSTKSIQVLVPELVVLLEIQVFNCNLPNMPILAEFQDVMVYLIQLKVNLVLGLLL